MLRKSCMERLDATSVKKSPNFNLILWVNVAIQPSVSVSTSLARFGSEIEGVADHHA